jgi:hypothetical protein
VSLRIAESVAVLREISVAWTVLADVQERPTKEKASR